MKTVQRELQTRDRGVGPGLLFPPGRNEHSDVLMTPIQEPVHGQLDPLARKQLLVSMATKKTRKKS